MPLCTLCGEDISNPRVELDLTSLNDKLRSQYGPASAQPDEVNSIVQCLQQDLKDYHSKLPTELSTAVPHARCISSYEVKLGSLLSPIRRLPYEVLHEIFDKCCVANYFEITNPGKKPECSIRNRPALALSSVCARWRRIVLSTPSLWARISLDWNWDVYGEVDPHADPLFSRFATFISRSLQRPMTVNFVFRERPYFEGSDSRLHPILELLVKQIHRWQSFSYQAPVSYVYSEDLFRIFRNRAPYFPLLEDAEFGVYSLLPWGVKFSQVTSPKLKALRIRDGSLTLKTLRARFPPEQITHLELASLTDHVFLEVLKAISNLTSLTIEEDFWKTNAGFYPDEDEDEDDEEDGEDEENRKDEEDEENEEDEEDGEDGEDKESQGDEEHSREVKNCGTDVPHVVLPSIETLTICHGGQKPGVSHPIFPLINLPSLKTLRFEPSEEPDRRQHFWRMPDKCWLNFDSFKAFVQSSFFPLTTLSLKKLSLSDVDLVQLLHLLPSLLNLTIIDEAKLQYVCSPRHSPVTEQLIESLTIARASPLNRFQAGSSVLVPKLQYLKLDINAPSFQDNLIVNMILSRRNSCNSNAVLSHSTGEDPGKGEPTVKRLQEFTVIFRNRDKPDVVVYEPLNLLEREGMRLALRWYGRPTRFFLHPHPCPQCDKSLFKSLLEGWTET